jgi:N-acetylneuraminic acid mutarotase
LTDRKKAHIYDALSDSWAPAADSNVGRFGSAVVSLRGRIFAFGGYGDFDTSSVEEYNPSTNSWYWKTCISKPKYIYIHTYL